MTIEQKDAAASVAEQLFDVMAKLAEPLSAIDPRNVPTPLGLLIWMLDVVEVVRAVCIVGDAAGTVVSCFALPLSVPCTDRPVAYGTVSVADWLSPTATGLNVTLTLQVLPLASDVLSQPLVCVNGPVIATVPTLAAAVPPFVTVTEPLIGWPSSVTGNAGVTAPSVSDGSPMPVPWRYSVVGLPAIECATVACESTVPTAVGLYEIASVHPDAPPVNTVPSAQVLVALV